MDSENMEVDSSDYEEVIEKTLIHVVLDNSDEAIAINSNSNIRLIGVESESPVLKVENKVYHFNEWKYIPGTAMFFEQINETKKIDPLFDNLSSSSIQYIGSSHKSLEMTKKETM